MKYELFVKLYNEALEYGDVDLYIAERGWQDWMDQFEESDLGDILTKIYTLSNQSVKQMRELKGLSRAAFCRAYNIKLRTAEDWDNGKGRTPDHTKMLIAYTFFMDDFLEN